MHLGSSNCIEEVRQRVQEAFSEQNTASGEGCEFVSPNGKYRVKQQVYKQAVKEWNGKISRIEVFDSTSNLISSFLIDDDNFFHHWILSKAGEYLLYAENLCGGNSVLNLGTRNIHSYSDGTDGFIFAGYYPSPDLTHMAILGCFWGAPYCIRIFDVSNIESLPWPMILEVELEDEESEEITWVDNNTIRISKYPKRTLEVYRDVAIKN